MPIAWMLLIGLLASVAIGYQNAGSALAYGWAVVHGAGLGAVLAFLPLAAGLGLLWAGYVFLRNTTLGGRPLIFAAYACTIVLLNGMLLPGTGDEPSSVRDTAHEVRIDKIGDELALSAAGNPIGVRLTFEAVVLRTGSYAVRPSPLRAQEGTHAALQLGRSIRESIEPEPDGGALRERVPYRFSRVLLPNFLGYDERTGQPCFEWSVMGTVREEVFVETVSRAAATPLRTAIWVSRQGAPEPVVAAEYVTARSYSLGAFYQTIVAEGNRRCGA